ncbi:MAG: LamG-like jellyroll fold domain-containing protein [Flavobacteriales bacterium]
MKKQLLFFSLTVLSVVLFAQAPTDGLVAKYYFNSGNASADVGVNNGVVTGASKTTDRFGNPNAAYSFDGNDNIKVPYYSALNVSAGLTISAWVKMSNNTNQQAIVSRWANSKSTDQYLLMTSSGTPLIATGNPTYSANGVTCTPTFNNGVWYHVVFEWTNSGDHKLFVNGVKTDSTRLASFATINSVAVNDLYFGMQSGGTRYFKGVIDDISIYNRALNYSEIAALYNEIDFATSVEDTKAAVMSIYPNPASEMLQVDLGTLQNASFKLYSLQGQLLLQQDNLSGSNALDVSTLVPGIYFTEITSGSAVSRMKIMVE